MRLEGWMKNGLMRNEAFIHNADNSNSNSNGGPLKVLLEAPLGGYQCLKRLRYAFIQWKCALFLMLLPTNVHKNENIYGVCAYSP